MADGFKYSELRPELVEKLKKFEQNKPEYRQLKATEDLLEVLALSSEKQEKRHKESVGHFKALGALFTDVREELTKLNKKEAPEAPDIVTPITKAIGKLKLDPKIEVQSPDVKVPEIKVPEVRVPEISVPTPQVHIEPADFKPLENKLKMIPAQLAKTVKSIPQTDLSPLLEKLDIMNDWLESIDNQSRRRPEPGAMPVYSAPGTTINTGSGLVTEDYDYVDVQQTSSTAETYVYKNGGSGGTSVATVVITYTDATKKEVDDMERTA